MTTALHNLLSPETCRIAIERFLREHVDVQRTATGLAVAMPTMYPDGWQVVVHIEPISGTTAKLTDRGQTLARLHEHGLNLAAKQTAALFDERKATFELRQDGLELFREIRLPPDGLDIQLFVESLVSIAHLVYRHEPVTTTDSAADQTLKKLLRQHAMEARVNHVLEGEIEREIRVDYYVQAKRELACQVVNRRGRVLDYMEQWAWRWTDLERRHPKLVKAMIYDPDKQEWDETTLKLGRKVCDLFCPYFETDQIGDLLRRVA